MQNYDFRSWRPRAVDGLRRLQDLTPMPTGLALWRDREQALEADRVGVEEIDAIVLPTLALHRRIMVSRQLFGLPWGTGSSICYELKPTPRTWKHVLAYHVGSKGQRLRWSWTIQHLCVDAPVDPTLDPWVARCQWPFSDLYLSASYHTCEAAMRGLRRWQWHLWRRWKPSYEFPSSSL